MRTFVTGLFAACLMALACASAAVAQPVKYYVSGTFNAPATGTWSGWYSLQPPNDIVAIDIRTTAGKANDGVTNLPASNLVYAGAQGPNGVALGTGYLPPIGTRGAGLYVSSSDFITATGLSQFIEGECLTAGCATLSTAPSLRRTSTTALSFSKTAPVPTMTEWTMILFALMLAGGAALVIQRRRASKA